MSRSIRRNVQCWGQARDDAESSGGTAEAAATIVAMAKHAEQGFHPLPLAPDSPCGTITHDDNSGTVKEMQDLKPAVGS